MTRSIRVLIGFLIFSSAFCMAQQVLSNESVIKMHQAGLGDAIVVSTVEDQPGKFSVGVDDLLALRAAGISNAVIEAMIKKGKASSQPAGTPGDSQMHQTPAPSDGPHAVTVPSSNERSASWSNRPRVFFQSQSYGTNLAAVRDQSMEMSADFERDCPLVQVSINQAGADYTIQLNHIERGLIVRDNQMQVADKNGDLLTGTAEGGSIRGGAKWLCGVITADWYFQAGNHYADERNYSDAQSWYKRAAAKGYAKAEFRLGEEYANGEGNPQDYAQAVYWYSKAADGDDANAEYSLGVLLHSGQGVPRDDSEAYYWVSIAAESGKLTGKEQERALKTQEQYASLLSRDALINAKKLVRKWFKNRGVKELHDDVSSPKSN